MRHSQRKRRETDRSVLRGTTPVLDPTEELPDEEASSIATRAEMLTAIAAAEGVPIEVLIQWIHTRVPGKIWSGEEWRRFSAKYSQTVRNL